MLTEPAETLDGLFIVKKKEHFLHWLAWKTWLREQLNRQFFPDVATVLSPWPPENEPAVASLVADYKLIAARIAKQGITAKPLPPNPKPWRRWTTMQAQALVAAERKDRAVSDRPAVTADMFAAQDEKV